MTIPPEMKKALHRVASGAVAGVLAALVVTTPGCGKKSNPVNPADRVCGGKYNLGARVSGRSSPFDFCVSDKDASVIFTSESRYDIRAQYVTSNTTFELQMLFPHNANFPVVLNLTSNLAAAESDPNGCWLYYSETASDGTTLESYDITDGSFTLTYSDGTVVAASFDGVTLKMRNQDTGTDAGTRTLDQGFLSLTVDS